MRIRDISISIKLVLRDASLHQRDGALARQRSHASRLQALTLHISPTIHVIAKKRRKKEMEGHHIYKRFLANKSLV